ncbi:MAG: Na+/H+ antiporter subunit B [Devosiaceae bacterium]|nr:Na+/H+ antiporter subunit B [Devosiaceae bacterium]
MNTVIFRTIAPILVAIMVVFSVFILLRGHNEPGGGFIGGLIAASAIAIYGIAAGVEEVRKALKFDPIAIAGFGVFIAGLAGLLSYFYQVPFLTGLWAYLDIGPSKVALSTPLLFDIGVYFAVLGTIAAIALALEEDEEGK